MFSLLPEESLRAIFGAGTHHGVIRKNDTHDRKVLQLQLHYLATAANPLSFDLAIYGSRNDALLPCDAVFVAIANLFRTDKTRSL